MTSFFRPILPVLLGVIAVELALGAMGPLIGVQLVQRGVANALIGAVTSAYFVGFLVGSLTCHLVIDRVGHIRAFCVFAVIATNFSLFFVLVASPYAWIVLRAVIGYSLAGQFLVIESWLNDKASPETRGRVFATYLVLSWGFSGVGPLLLNVADPGGSTLFVVIAMGFADHGPGGHDAADVQIVIVHTIDSWLGRAVGRGWCGDGRHRIRAIVTGRAAEPA